MSYVKKYDINYTFSCKKYLGHVRKTLGEYFYNLEIEILFNDVSTRN